MSSTRFIYIQRWHHLLLFLERLCFLYACLNKNDVGICLIEMTLLCLVLHILFIYIFVSNIFQLAFFKPNRIIRIFLLLSNNICLLSVVLEHVCSRAGVSVRHYCEIYSTCFLLVQPASESYRDSYQELPSYSHIFCMRPFQRNYVISKGLDGYWAVNHALSFIFIYIFLFFLSFSFLFFFVSFLFSTPLPFF